MKQACLGLVVAAAMLAAPALAFGQGKQPPKGGDKPAAGEASAGEGDTAGEQPTEGEAPAEGETPAEGEGEDEGGLGDICKIDPAACPTIDMEKAAKRPLNPEMYAVQQIYALKQSRVEINPYFSFTMNDQFVSHNAPGLALNYYLTNVLALGVSGNWYQGLNAPSDFNFETSRAARIGQPITEYQWNGNLNFSYVPAYGKFAGFGDFIFHYDLYLVIGVGAISTRPIAVVDPDNRTFDFKIKGAANAGAGLRIFFNRWFAMMLEVRDYIFFEELENPTIDPDPTNAEKWLTEGTSFTNNVQAQVGFSVFLPFSWDYKLPK